MESKELKEMLAQFEGEVKKTTTDLKTLLEKQSGEIKQHGETAERTAKAIAAVEEKLNKLGADYEALKARADELEKKSQRPGYGTGAGEEAKSLGEQFVESEAYKTMITNKQESCTPVRVKSLFAPGWQKALTSDAASAGALVVPYRYPELIAPPMRTRRVRDLLTVQPVSSNAIEFVQVTGFVNRAAMVAEGEAKPESALTFELKTESVKTLAHWIPATRQIINDAAQLRAYIDTQLVYGVKLTEDAQILYGNGVSTNLQGIMTHPSIQNYAWSEGEVGDTKIDAIRRAMTKIRVAEYEATGIVLHPNDWEDIELAKGSDGHYIWIIVTMGGEQRLWRLPVVDTTAINEGEALVGAFAIAAMLWDREDASVRVSEHHADFFIKNMIAVLAEERLALTNFRPEAFVAVDFDQAPVAGS